MEYVDGYVLPVLKKNVKAYRKMAALGAKMWMDAGALEYYECVGEDLKPAFGVPFTKVMKTKPAETVVFAFVVFKSRAHRDRVLAKVMKDPRMQNFDPADMPMDATRMAYGGFEVLVKGRPPGGR